MSRRIDPGLACLIALAVGVVVLLPGEPVHAVHVQALPEEVYSQEEFRP